ncbi:MAG TPA: DNA-3-methyladenine glycosylase 2 family protein [Actinomycetota bacterium]|jgi:AraC family transcriptional regulator of adaptative response / DNA-3-methyladenine glycosylase II|nr:DNA-3-methyladenine glycosylase 2 family protein [Actinomycetota bacterium]
MDFDFCYRAVASKDSRFDGHFVTGVTSTGIYCRPSCPAITPKRQNVRFFRTAAAAQQAGFRACKRCLPDASPGSPEWNLRADLVGRAMRLIADGVVDRDGVAGLAHRLGYSERHLNRQMTAELGAGPLAVARAQRAHTARLLLERTAMTVTDIAFAAGFASIRQFNDTMRAVFAATPTQLRHRTRRGLVPEGGEVTLRLPYRAPYDYDHVLAFLAERAVQGVEAVEDDTYRRSLALPHGEGVAEISPGRAHLLLRLHLADIRDLQSAVARLRRLFDLDADPVAVSEVLARDSLLRPIVERSPGRRVPGAVDGFEAAVRAVLGQQVSVSAARTLAGRLVRAFGKPLQTPRDGVTHLFPSPEVLAGGDGTGLDPGELGLTGARRRTLAALASAVADGEVVLDAGADRAETARRLLQLPGVGPWTVSYLAMRALGDPDAFPASDLGVLKAMQRLGGPSKPRDIEERSRLWSPFRAYATQHLWSALVVSNTQIRTKRGLQQSARWRNGPKGES